jgi:hypothetical protein
MNFFLSSPANANCSQLLARTLRGSQTGMNGMVAQHDGEPPGLPLN